MIYNLESKRPPKLVNEELFKKVAAATTTELPKKSFMNRWGWMIFVVFMIFFLYNCKYGMFRATDIDPLPYSLSYSLKQ